MKQYEELKVGQIRLKGDEVRRADVERDYIKCYGVYSGNLYGGRRLSVPECPHFHEPIPPIPGPWEPVQLIGHSILQSDLMIAEFRREVVVD